MPSTNTNPKPPLDAKLTDRILAEIKEEELVAMCCDVINIPSPTGQELAMAEYMRNALKQLTSASRGRKSKKGGRT